MCWFHNWVKIGDNTYSQGTTVCLKCGERRVRVVTGHGVGGGIGDLGMPYTYYGWGYAGHVTVEELMKLRNQVALQEKKQKENEEANEKARLEWERKDKEKQKAIQKLRK